VAEAGDRTKDGAQNPSPDPKTEELIREEETIAGTVAGAIAGGLVGGWPGAIVGGAVGSIIGHETAEHEHPRKAPEDK
jgi:hypothetical protein